MPVIPIIHIIRMHCLLITDKTQYEYSCTNGQNSIAFTDEFKRNEWRLDDFVHICEL